MEIHNPTNEIVIDELFAFMTEDAKGFNGIVAHVLPDLGTTPLVTGSRRTAEKMKPVAEAAARLSGQRVHLFRFKREGEMWRSGAPDA